MDKDDSLVEKTVGFLLAQILSIAYMARSLSSQESVAELTKIAAIKAAGAADPILGEKRVKEIIRETMKLCAEAVIEWNKKNVDDLKEKGN